MKILIFDDECILCSKFVDFLVKFDVKKQFYFTCIQDEKGLSLLQKHKLVDVDSIVLIQDEKVFLKSRAIFELAKSLDSWPKHLYLLRWVPLPLSDYIYDFIAKHRYEIFGKKQSCLLMNETLKGRLL